MQRIIFEASSSTLAMGITQPACIFLKLSLCNKSFYSTNNNCTFTIFVPKYTAKAIDLVGGNFFLLILP